MCAVVLPVVLPVWLQRRNSEIFFILKIIHTPPKGGRCWETPPTPHARGGVGVAGGCLGRGNAVT